MDHSQYIRQNFNTIWPAHLTAFTRLLIQLRERFDGDLDLALVLSVIGSRTRPEIWTPELISARDITSSGDEEERQYPINIQSVAAYSGIPRETFRRKVIVLQSKGWVTRDAEGQLEISRTAAKDLADETEHTISYLAALRTAVDAGSG